MQLYEFEAEPSLLAFLPELQRTVADAAGPAYASHETELSDLVRYLSESIEVASPPLFLDFVRWCSAVLEERGHGPALLLQVLDALEGAVQRLVPGLPEAAAYVRSAREMAPQMAPPESHLQAQAPLAGVAMGFFEALLQGDRREAHRIVVDQLDAGTSIRDVYLHVFQASQREIGRRWQMNQMSVAQEHFCTAATQHIMAQLYPRLFTTRRLGRSMVMACVSGELHEIGARMVTDFFEMEGWDTHFLGANTPIPDIVATVAERRPDVLGISTTISRYLGGVTALIAAVRANAATAHIPILAGGYPFNVDPELARRIGADAHAPDADAAIHLATDLHRHAA